MLQVGKIPVKKARKLGMEVTVVGSQEIRERDEYDQNLLYKIVKELIKL